MRFVLFVIIECVSSVRLHVRIGSNGTVIDQMKILFTTILVVSMGVVVCSQGAGQDVPASELHQADVIVYGDASGGVTAAIQAARMGKSVILISQYGHLGGMTSSGLGWTDIGNTAILGGLSREFYHRVYQHYQQDSAWNHEPRSKFQNKGQGSPALNPETELASTFEPKVAEAVFDAMVKQAGVKVIKGHLDLDPSHANRVVKSKARITSIRLEDGTIVKGKMFIDASYEGDLMAAAGVSFVMGRESNAEYGETGNGITGPRHGNQLRTGLDPYVVKGDASSGLLPGVNADMGGKIGDGDHRFQAYCYRLALTKVVANRVPIPKPANYDAADFEILFRAIEKGQHVRFFKTTMVPNAKTDANNASGISCDFIGGNYGTIDGKRWNWATLNRKQREAVAAKHRYWQLGLLWTLQHHPRVPKKLRDEIMPWGLAKDEFVDNDNWPYNIYVREARRMKSDFVMTENHCKLKVPVEESVGMGAYTLDSHNVQRFVFKGMIKNEGDIQTYLRGKAYSISYRSIVPRKSECENLLVPWSLSATHIAFGSIRMEPVFMILGQSAATAACMAIDDKTSVQAVPYKKLRARLVKDGQKL
jgi:hypothetical protein